MPCLICSQQDAQEKNDEFVQTTWARAQRDNLSPDAFNRLLCEHSGDIEHLRRIREAESRKLNEELERRKMKIHSRQTEDESSENSEEDTLSDRKASILKLPMPSMTMTHSNSIPKIIIRF